MGHLFRQMLETRLTNCLVGGWVELYNIERKRYEQPPCFEETELIAKETLHGLEYNLHIREHRGEISEVGDFFLDFPNPGHFMILARSEELYAAVVSISWRGDPVLKENRRQGYISFLRRYFKEEDS